MACHHLKLLNSGPIGSLTILLYTSHHAFFFQENFNRKETEARENLKINDIVHFLFRFIS